MNCPIDNTELHITERQGIEIDYCPKCRGVWLDRGELDKIIDRAGPMPVRDAVVDARPRPTDPYQEDVSYRDDSRHEHDSYGNGGGTRRKKSRRSFLEDIFDFD